MARITIVSHWCQLIENLQYSSMEFYKSVEQAIKKREVPDANPSRVEHYENGIFAAKREYLRIERKNFAFDICAAPFGNGFFVSSWYGKAEPGGGFLILLGVIFASFVLLMIFSLIFGILGGMSIWFMSVPIVLLAVGFLIQDGKLKGEDWVLATPVLGWLYEKIFHPMSYYKMDTIQMYQSAVHNAVMEVIDEITKAKGLHSLSESERKPVLKEFSASKQI